MFLVLIDTSSYEDIRLSFKGSVFDSLAQLSHEDKITIIGCDVLQREMESHMRESIAQSVNRVNKVQSNFERITADDLGEVTRMLSDINSLKERIFDERKARMDTFFGSVRFENLDLSVVNVQEVLHDYFNKKPPFGEGKKKNEFPDAFVLNAFVSQYNDKLDSTCIISKDQDWQKFIEQFPKVKKFRNIPEFIDFIHGNYNDEFINRLKRVLTDHNDEISERIKEEIHDYEFEIDDYWIDPELEMHSENTKVEILENNIIALNPENTLVEVIYKIDLEFTLWAGDETTQYKDDDTNSWHYFGTNRYLLQTTKTETMTMSVSFDPHPDDLLESFEIDEISIPKDFYYLNEHEYTIELSQHWNED